MDLILFLQQFDFGWLVMTMKAITFMGNEEFYLLILPVLYWCWRKNYVLPLAIILLLNFWLNYEFKEFFQLPRPAGVALIPAEHFGFPSGHAQGAMVLWGYLAWILSGTQRKIYGWLGALIFGIGLSRIYLGVHFPGDVVGGWTIGFLILFSGIWITVSIRRQELVFPALPTAILALFSGMMLALMSPSGIAVRVGGMIAGLVGGMLIESEWLNINTRVRWWQQGLKIIIGVAGLLILKSSIKALFPLELWADWIRYGMLGLWIGLGAPWLFSRLRLTKN